MCELLMMRMASEKKNQEMESYKRQIDMDTHTQCVLHIIRLRLIIFHTPKNFHGRNKIE